MAGPPPPPPIRSPISPGAAGRAFSFISELYGRAKPYKGAIQKGIAVIQAIRAGYQLDHMDHSDPEHSVHTIATQLSRAAAGGFGRFYVGTPSPPVSSAATPAPQMRPKLN